MPSKYVRMPVARLFSAIYIEKHLLTAQSAVNRGSCINGAAKEHNVPFTTLYRKVKVVNFHFNILHKLPRM